MQGVVISDLLLDRHKMRVKVHGSKQQENNKGHPGKKRTGIVELCFCDHYDISILTVYHIHKPSYGWTCN